MFIKICLFLSAIVLASGDRIGFQPKPMHPIRGKIVGGFLIDIAQVPWQASVQVDESHYCGASIISEKWILTAAHCMEDIAANNLTVRVGTSQHSSGGSVHRVKNIVQHKNFSELSFGDYDVSLLELKDKVEFSENVQAVLLIEKDQLVEDNTTCLVTGWGETKTSESSLNLQGVEIPIFNQNKCKKNYEDVTEITPRMLCAGFEEGGKGSCNGDSGGPLVIYDNLKKTATQIGIVSWRCSDGCAEPNDPSVFTRISEVRDWIFKKTGI